MKSAKLPAIQFYPGDWRKDVGVQSLSYHDRGIWFELLLLMHDSEERGVLTLNRKPITEEQLARLLGLDKQILTTTLTSLHEAGVASIDPVTGGLMSRRMVRDEALRKIRIKAGTKGGNPALVKQKSTTGDKQNPTPSSSSSISTSIPTLAVTSEEVPADRGALILTLPLNSGEYSIHEKDVEEARELYPAVNVLQDFRNMKGWLMASPKRRKTRHGIRKFINAWLSRSQDKAGGSADTKGPNPNRYWKPEDSNE